MAASGINKIFYSSPAESTAEYWSSHARGTPESQTTRTGTKAVTHIWGLGAADGEIPLFIRFELGGTGTFSSEEIPAGSIITKANLIMTSVTDVLNAPLTCEISNVASDGQWDNDTVAFFGGGFNKDTEVDIRNSALTTLATTGISLSGITTRFNLLNNPTSNVLDIEAAGAVLLCSTSGSVDTIRVRCRRVGSPGGNCSVKIYETTTDSDGKIRPTLLLGASAAVAISTVGTGASGSVVTFSTITPATSISAGSYYAVIVTSEATPNSSAFLQVVYGPLNPAGADQNTYAITYGTLVSAFSSVCYESLGQLPFRSRRSRFAGPLALTGTTWPIDARLPLGNSSLNYITRDIPAALNTQLIKVEGLEGLIQQVIDQPGYNPTQAKLALQLKPVSGTPNDTFRAISNNRGDGISKSTLEISWRPAKRIYNI